MKLFLVAESDPDSANSAKEGGREKKRVGREEYK